jgi:hypothetical protein
MMTPICPSCDSRLAHGINIVHGGKAEHVFFCKNPKCPSPACRESYAAEKPDDALFNLEVKFQAEQEKGKAQLL